MALTQVSTNGVKDGSLLNADINASAAIAKSKIETLINNNADNRVITGSGTANTLNAESNVVIDSSGNVGIGTTSPDSLLHVYGASTAFAKIETGDGSTNPIIMHKNPDRTWHAGLRGDTSDSYVIRDATATANRLVIDSSGKVGIGTTSPSSFDADGDDFVVSTSGHTGITINSGSAGSTSRGSIYFAEGTAGDNDKTRGAIQYQHGDDFMRFTTNAAERMRIDSSGNLLIGGTVTEAQGALTLEPNRDDGAGRITFNRANTTAVSVVVEFQNNNSQVGVINHDHTSCGIFTTSDYRAKENVLSISDGITRLKTLKPYKFNFIADATKTVDGFFAHEVQSVVPEAITGTKDEVDSDNNPVYQAIDQSKLVPLLTAALQEAVTKIETLETKVAALEAA